MAELRSNHVKISVLLIALGLLIAVSAQANSIVAPNALETVAGNSRNGFPFTTNALSMAYQQIYDASQFASASGPIEITAVSYRPDSTSSPFTLTMSDVEIYLSTTSVAPDAMNPTFAANLGGDNTLVRAGSLTVSSDGPDGLGDWEIGFALQNTFVYDPSQGNLLMYVKKNSAEGLSPAQVMDAELTIGDSVSRLWNTSGSGATTGTLDSSGLVTRFTYTPVPLPSALAAGLTLMGGMGLLRRQRA